MTSPAAVLDHVAIGTRQLDDGWELFGRLLGGRWLYGGDIGFWWGQLGFASGPKIELLTPLDDPGSAFLDRFLTVHGAGPHHLNFMVPDIEATLAAVRGLGIEPVGVRLGDPVWREAFLHPKDAQGIVIQVAQPAGEPPAQPPPASLGLAGPATAFALVEHRVDDLAAAVRLFTEALGGTLEPGARAGEAELTWPGGRHLRLDTAAGDTAPGTTVPGAPGAGRTRLTFTRALAARSDRERAGGGDPASTTFPEMGSVVTAADQQRAAELAARLGVRLHLTGA